MSGGCEGDGELRKEIGYRDVPHFKKGHKKVDCCDSVTQAEQECTQYTLNTLTTKLYHQHILILLLVVRGLIQTTDNLYWGKKYEMGRGKGNIGRRRGEGKGREKRNGERLKGDKGKKVTSKTRTLLGWSD